MPPTGRPATVTPSGTRAGGAASPPSTGARTAMTRTETPRRRNTCTDRTYAGGRGQGSGRDGGATAAASPRQALSLGNNRAEAKGREERKRMDEQQLNETAAAIVAEGKGILAADESDGTIKTRFDSIGIDSTEEHRRAYRDLLFTTEGVEEYISGVILFDETIRQSSVDGTPFPK